VPLKNQQNDGRSLATTTVGGRTGDNASQADRGGHQGRGGNNDGRDQGDRGRCSIIGHEKHRHDWRGCNLNPCSRHHDAALVTAEAVDEAVEESKAVAAFRAVAMDAATTTPTTAAVVKIITVEIKACVTEAPHKDLAVKATGAATTTRARLRCSPHIKVA